jgi:hypothetical protein
VPTSRLACSPSSAASPDERQAHDTIGLNSEPVRDRCHRPPDPSASACPAVDRCPAGWGRGHRVAPGPQAPASPHRSRSLAQPGHRGGAGPPADARPQDQRVRRTSGPAANGERALVALRPRPRLVHLHTPTPSSNSADTEWPARGGVHHCAAASSGCETDESGRTQAGPGAGPSSPPAALRGGRGTRVPLPGPARPPPAPGYEPALGSTGLIRKSSPSIWPMRP